MTKRTAAATRGEPGLFDTESAGPAPKPATKPRPKPLKAADLPLRAPLIHGEATASLLLRTAAANAVEPERLLKALHTGRLDLPAGGVQPQQHEVRLSAGALERLAALLERPAEQLQHLPGLRAEALLDEPGAVVRIEPWSDELGGTPLPACPLCMEAGAWLAPDGHRWRPCPCGRRWTASDDGGYLLDTSLLPDLGRALLRHRDLDHRLGPAGDALVADAHQVMLWWWVSKQVAHETWRSREDALGAARHRRRAAPAVVYPEAVTLAEAMGRWEQRRRRPDASPVEWLAEVAELFEVTGIVRGREREPLRHWLLLHPAGADPVGDSTAERRWSQLPALHHRPAEPGPWRATSCLRWMFGLPLTSTTAICPHCQGRALSCLWSPAPDCPEKPAASQG
ncbi:TniQ family protein [Kitasatospora sp. NPDC059646]|uniref:TniQ family protein n=1 Tax=Kitasatospora sp. NPDC059646 TaxID=3346893 RepID=UPI0036C2021A